MVYYLIKRVIYFVPTIALVLFFCFFLLESIPGDPVTDIILSDDNYNLNAQNNYQKTYDELASQFNFDLPAFYFSIFPKNKKTAFNEPSPLAKKIKKEWLGKYPLSAYQAFYKGLSEIESTIKDDTAFSMQKTLPIIQELPLTPLIALPFTLKRISDNIGPQHRLRIQGLQKDLEESKVSFSQLLPSFKWNGPNNRFNIWILNAITGNWGNSTTDGLPVNNKIFKAIQWTLYISIFTVFLAFLIGVPLGLYGAHIANTKKEKIISSTLFVLYAIPVFWLATIFIVFFTTDEYGSWTNIFPSAGIYLVGENQNIFQVFFGHFSQMILPIICLTLGSIAYVYRQMRSNSLDELVKPYSLTAQAKGLAPKTILKTHIAQNSIYPLVGLLATILPGLIAGSLIVEILFNIPGMGRLLLDAISTKDWNVILGIIITTSIFTFIGFLVADILLYIINPKVRYA